MNTVRTYIPMHEDKDLNDEWWAARGVAIGENNHTGCVVHYNTMRDGSGRFKGYAVTGSTLDSSLVETVAGAIDALHRHRQRASRNGVQGRYIGKRRGRHFRKLSRTAVPNTWLVEGTIWRRAERT